jgi:hypothetical protein
MLRVIPKGWFSYDYTVFERDGTPVGQVDLSNWRETAKLEVGGEHYTGHREGWRSQEFALEKEDGQVVVTAEKASAWKGPFVFEYGGNRYELEKESIWKSTFIIRREGVGRVGSVRSEGVFKREFIAELPQELSLEAKVFIVWLVVLLWKRAASTAAAGGGGAAGASG